MASNKHHRKPRSRGGARNTVNGIRNIIRVDEYQHHSWHILFSNLDAQEIVKIINDIWLDPEWEFVCRKRKHNKHKKTNGGPRC